MKITIIEKFDRKVLIEGRNTGMSYAFLQKIDNDIYHTVHPSSPCKDYLSEIVFSENTGYPTNACGLDYPKKYGIFDNGELYLAIKIVKDKYGSSYYYSKDINDDINHLKANYKHIEALLSHIEDLLCIEQKSVLEEANDGYFLVTGSLDWRISTIAISLYTLLIRCALVYDGKESPMDFLKNYKYNASDVSLLKSSMPKLEAFIEAKRLPEQPDFNKELAAQKKYCPHSCGIISLNMDTFKKQLV